MAGYSAVTPQLAIYKCSREVEPGQTHFQNVKEKRKRYFDHGRTLSCPLSCDKYEVLDLRRDGNENVIKIASSGLLIFSSLCRFV